MPRNKEVHGGDSLTGTLDVDKTMHPQTPKPFWRRGLAGFLDFVMVFFVGGYAIVNLTGETTPDGFSLRSVSALVLFAVIALYFYLGRRVLGGTVWQRILRAR